MIPTIHARAGDALYFHGSPASRMLRTLGAGVDVCVTATLVDGVVFARSVFKHSLNYRSAVVLGRAREVEDVDEKRAALRAVVEHVARGRAADARPPSEKELAATAILAVAIEDASAKVRTGGPTDFEDDLQLPVWAGVLPLALVPGEPRPDDGAISAGTALPGYVAHYARPRDD